MKILLPQFILPSLFLMVQQSILMSYWHISHNKLQQGGQTKYNVSDFEKTRFYCFPGKQSSRPHRASPWIHKNALSNSSNPGFWSGHITMHISQQLKRWKVIWGCNNFPQKPLKKGLETITMSASVQRLRVPALTTTQI